MSFLATGEAHTIISARQYKKIVPTPTGLAWHNLGVLLSRLGALQTARIAYEKATLVEPQISSYHYAYIEFLIQK